MKYTLLTAVALLMLAACNSNQSSKPMSQGPASHKVLIKEVLQVSGYTYLKAEEDKKEVWLAASPVEAKPGETWYYEGGYEMRNFTSKELNRTFETIYFLDMISPEPIDHSNDAKLSSPGSSGTKEERKDVTVTPAAGGITISELYSNKGSYKGKTVRVTGKVTKFLPEIMEKNWVHIQDGTESGGNYELIITTSETVNAGDVVTFEGKIDLDKDFGFGYFYSVIMEDSKITK
jgi:hypothetical protein